MIALRADNQLLQTKLSSNSSLVDELNQIILQEKNNSQKLISANTELTRQIKELEYYKDIYSAIVDENDKFLNCISILEEKRNIRIGTVDQDLTYTIYLENIQIKEQ